jgi:ADP-ribose pyrophosphatase YjhB (NUDIX family)
MNSIFQHSKNNPYHVSVGAIVVHEGKILVHKHVKKLTPERLHIFLGDLDEVYTLMRESLENNESLENAVIRGVKEEFGVQGDVIRYLGSIQAHVPLLGGFEKTTLYFEVTCREVQERPSDDEEAHTLLEWHKPEDLLLVLEKQEQQTTRQELMEAKIVKAYLASRA